MSIKIMSEVWKHSKQKGAGLLAMLALADWSNDDGFCWYSQSEVAKRARVSRRQVNNILAKCESDLEIVRAQRSEHKTTIYTVICGVDEAESKRRIKAANEMPHIVNPAALVNPSTLGVVNPSTLGVVNPATHDPLSDDPSIDPPDSAGQQPEEKPEKPGKAELDAMFDLICEVCGLDTKTAPASQVGKVRKELIALGWTSAGLTTFRDWRKTRALAPIGSVHWLAGELAKTNWRTAARRAERQPDQAQIDFVNRKRAEKEAREQNGEIPHD